MVSVATLRTFEMDLSVSLTLWNSRVKPKENEVLNFTMSEILFNHKERFRWNRMGTITPGSTHPDKKVEHLPVRENALC